MKIDTRQVHDVTVVDMTGRLDTQTSGYAYDEMVRIAKGEAGKVVLNVNNLEYLSSAGLRVILTAAKLLQAAAGEMKICQANGVVKDVLETSGFDNLAPIIHDGHRI